MPLNRYLILLFKCLDLVGIFIQIKMHYNPLLTFLITGKNQSKTQGFMPNLGVEFGYIVFYPKNSVNTIV